MLDFLRNISPTEFAIIAAIIILIFGSRIAIKMGKTSGETLREMKNIKKNVSEALDDNPSS